MVKKFIQYAMGNFLALLLGFLSTPIITRIISPTEMGKFSLFNTVTSLLYLFMMVGTDQAYVRYYNSESEDGKIVLLRKCVGLSLGISVITSIIILFFYSNISQYISGENDFGVIVLLIFNVISTILQRFSVLEVRMSLDGKFYSFLNVLHKITYIIFVFMIYGWLADSGKVLMFATVLSNAISFLVCLFVRNNSWLKSIDKKNVNVKTFEMIKFGFPFVFSSAINWIFEYMDRMSIKYYCDFSEVGIYSAASTITALLTSCQTAFTAFWIPVAYEKYSNDPDCKEFFVEMNKMVSYIMFVIAIFLIVGKDLLIIILGSEYSKAVYVFPFLAFMPVMYTISETTVLGINFTKKTKMHIVIASVSAIINLIGNIVFVPIWGAKGAAIATGISYIVFFGIRTYISKKLYEVKYEMPPLIYSVLILAIVTIYCTFNVFSLKMFFIGSISVFALSFFYRDVFLEIMRYLRKKLKNIILKYIS